MVTIEQAIQALRDTVQFDLRHPHYDATVELSEFLYKLSSGKDQEDLVTSYKERESEEQGSTAEAHAKHDQIRNHSGLQLLRPSAPL